MTRSSNAALRPPYVVRNSKVHGNGVFATRKIPADACIIEYQGKRISWKEAVRRENAKPADNFHTFFFSLESGKIIDGGDEGNDARWINHACEPNCEAREEDGKVFIYARRDIVRGEELNYDYGLILEQRHTPALKRAYACLCGAPTCRHTLLAPKRKKKIT
jgi:SET domain-containing protein